MKEAFTRFLGAETGRLHFAAHSHHPWPDVTFAAHIRAWEDAALLMDDKWDHIFGEVFPGAQRSLAATLGLPDPDSIVFAPNTHEFILRIASCFEPPIKILTTDAEFHSFSRQVSRWEEDGLVAASRVPAEPFSSFSDRFVDSFDGHDLVFLSHVHFDSGFVTENLTSVVQAIPETAAVVIDGYHGFMAIPTDLSAIASRTFYLSGGYKYAMAGEGACFLHVPPSAPSRPVNTGWWAGFDSLTRSDGKVSYGPAGWRFAGATADPSGVYRLAAVLAWLTERGVTVEGIHDHVRRLQAQLLRQLPQSLVESLLPPAGTEDRGHFLTFRRADADHVYRSLHDRGVVTDFRGDRHRIGFGIYHDENDVDFLAEHLIAIGA